MLVAPHRQCPLVSCWVQDADLPRRQIPATGSGD